MKLTIRTKLLGVCVILQLLLAICAGLGIRELATSDDRLDSIVRGPAAAARLGAQLRSSMALATRAQRDLMLAGDKSERESAAEDIDRFIQQRVELRRQLGEAIAPPQVGKLEELDRLWTEAMEREKAIRALKMKATTERATALALGDGRKRTRELHAALRAVDAAFTKRAATGDFVRLIGTAAAIIPAIETNEAMVILVTDVPNMDAELAAANDGEKALRGAVDRLAGLAVTPDERHAVDELRSTLASWSDVHGKIRALGRENADYEATQLGRTQYLPLVLKGGKVADELVTSGAAALDAAREASQSAYTHARALLVGALVLAIALGFAIMFVIVRYIGRSLRSAGDLASAVAGGDLTHTLEVTNRDEVGVLVTALNDMVGKLRGVANDVSASAANVAAGAEEMSASAQQVATGAGEQSAATEETTAAMEEMAASVQQNADNANQTDHLASKASSDAESSGRAVAETLTAMKHIAEKISIVEEIARKTDLLALNAAVEAARAGEHGKGFAVVASEVRKLAERSATAAGEISTLSRSGVSLAENAGIMLTRLVPDIRKTAGLVQEVSAASREQSAGIEQTNKALQDLDRVTQQNAAAAEEMATTASELSNQAQQLQLAVGFFKLHDSERTPVAPAPRAPAAGEGPRPVAARSRTGHIATVQGHPSNGRPADHAPRGGLRAERPPRVTHTGRIHRKQVAPAHGDLDPSSGPAGDGRLFERNKDPS